MSNTCPWKSLIEQLGGESQVSFLIQAYCENIQEDPDLKMVFKRIETERLAELMTNLLHMGFAYSSHESMVDDDVRSRIILKNYTLFQLEVDSDQLKKLQDHFESALHDSWVEEQVFEQCTERFADLRAIFEEESMNLPRSSTMGAECRVVSARSA